MQFGRVAAAAAVLLCFGTVIPLSAQRDGQGDRQARPDRPQGGQDRGAPQQRPQPQQQQQPQRRAEQPRQQQQPQQRAEQPRQQQPQQRAEQPRQQQPQQRAEQPRQQQQPQQRAEQPRQQQPQPQPRAQQARQQPQRSQEQARSWQQQKGWVRQGGWQGHDSWQQNRAQHWSSDHRTWAQRGGYGGYYIPRDRFSLYFGRQHFFRIRTRPYIYLGYPRFDYAGFSFLLVDPWPEYWSEYWYDSDDVYIDYDDYDAGYYLYNRRYPEVRLAITLVM